MLSNPTLLNQYCTFIFYKTIL